MAAIHYIRTPAPAPRRLYHRAREVADAVQDFADIDITDLDRVARHLGIKRASLDRALLRDRHYRARDAAQNQETKP